MTIPAQRPSWLADRPALSSRMEALLADGDVTGTYGQTGKKRPAKVQRSNHGHAVTSALATSCARNGWARNDFLHVMLQSPAKGGRHIRHMAHRHGHDRAVEYGNRVWQAAQDLIARSGIGSRQDSYADLYALRDAISCASWRGISGSTAMRVLMAHFTAAERAGGRMHTLSYREAAEIAGCTTATAYRATRQRLGGWLRQVDSGDSTHGSTWVLLDGSQAQNTSKGRQAGGAQSNVSSVRNGELDGAVIQRLMGLDAFAHRGLGASSLKILAALYRRDGQSVAELLESAMVSQATAYRHLKRLAQHDLAVKDGEVWQLTETAQEAVSGAWGGWDRVATIEGTFGTSWRRHRLHEDQRAIWHGQVLPRLRERRMPDVTPLRGDEADPAWTCDGKVVDPVTGEVLPDLVVASDGRLMMVDEEPDYDELLRRAREADLIAA